MEKVKTFNGKRYTFYAHRSKKTSAITSAKRLFLMGNLRRIVPSSSGGYDIYVGKKYKPYRKKKFLKNVRRKR